MMTRRRFAALAVCAIAVLAGCGRSDPFDYVRVSGKVTYEDGSVIPANIMVTFVPQSEPLGSQTHPRSGVAEIDSTDGTFETITSHRYGDGLVRGRHKVLVQAFNEELNPSDAVPPRYGDLAKTPLEVDTADAPFHLKVARE